MEKKVLLFVVAISLFAIEAAAMVAEPTKVTVWRRGETIAGEEFLVANEAIVDYIATLPRPTEPLKGYRYGCMVKSRYISPTVTNTAAGSPSQWVPIRMVYQLSDCAPIRD